MWGASSSSAERSAPSSEAVTSKGHAKPNNAPLRKLLRAFSREKAGDSSKGGSRWVGWWPRRRRAHAIPGSSARALTPTLALHTTAGKPMACKPTAGRGRAAAATQAGVHQAARASAAGEKGVWPRCHLHASRACRLSRATHQPAPACGHPRPLCTRHHTTPHATPPRSSQSDWDLMGDDGGGSKPLEASPSLYPPPTAAGAASAEAAPAAGQEGARGGGAPPVGIVLGSGGRGAGANGSVTHNGVRATALGADRHSSSLELQLGLKSGSGGLARGVQRDDALCDKVRCAHGAGTSVGTSALSVAILPCLRMTTRI